jgi:branched-chain amino acid transport system ATP-binding protein
MARPLLRVDGLSRRFGGLSAADAVSLEVAAGEVHALIGPNGAGKSTLIALLAGELVPDAGRIAFDGDDITRLPVARRVQRGLVRSYQITSILPRLTVADNVALAVQTRHGHSYRFFKPAHRDTAVRGAAGSLLEAFGLGARAEAAAGELAHGEQRQLELAMTLATRPRLLLLDEPTAGMGVEETAAIIAMLRRLKGRVAMLLVEHDMDVVFALADIVTVLVYGHVIARGDPDAIRADPLVREAYLGEGEA